MNVKSLNKLTIVEAVTA